MPLEKAHVALARISWHSYGKKQHLAVHSPFHITCYELARNLEATLLFNCADFAAQDLAASLPVSADPP
jgi:uncharacterized protein with PIN domain